jgi:anti-sigma regulatory factor (Ser/Thr protein kinase)
MEKKNFSANLVNLYPMLIWIRERLYKYFTQIDLDKIELASEEVIVNIIEHGYKKKKGTIGIQIDINEHVEIIFKDRGVHFDILKNKKRKPKKTTIDKKKNGGMGIYLIFQMVDEVEYHRKNSSNILILKKKRSLNY